MALGEYSKYASLGISLVLTTAVYLFLGYRAGIWLDARWETAPTFMVVGIVLGMVLSVVSLVKELLVLTKPGEASATPSDKIAHAPDSEKNNFPKGGGVSGRGATSKGKDER